MAKPRIVARRATYAITRRTVFRKAFLGWWSEVVDDIWFWCLALACAKCGVTLHHAVRVGSHYHLTVTCLEENLGEFLWWLNHSMSCALNALLVKERYDAPGQLFDGRQTHVMRLVDAEAQMTDMVYSRVNPPTAGLSTTCDGIPGRTLPPAMWKSSAGIELKRPGVYFASGPKQRRLRTEPQPLLYLAFDGDVDALVHHLTKLEREAERTIRDARKGRPVRNHDEVRAIHPYDEPKTLREPGGQMVPCFKVGGGPLARMKGAIEVTAWRTQYAEARKRWEAGDREAVFPYGTYEMRRRYGAEVAEPDSDAWVSAPGITMAEAKAIVAAGDGERDGDLVNRVRESVLEGLDELLREEPEVRPETDEPVNGEATNRPRPPAITLHRFANWRRRSGDEDPRRLIPLSVTSPMKLSKSPAASPSSLLPTLAPRTDLSSISFLSPSDPRTPYRSISLLPPLPPRTDLSSSIFFGSDVWPAEPGANEIGDPLQLGEHRSRDELIPPLHVVTDRELRQLAGGDGGT